MQTTTLTNEPVHSVIAKLFAEAEALSPQTQSVWADLSEADQARLMQDKSSYQAFYARLKDLPLPVSHETGRLLYMLTVNSRAQAIVEFGTSFGISTIHLAAGLRDNGATAKGSLVTTEFENAKLNRAQANLAEAGLADLVDFREGDALQTLSLNLPEQIDLVFLDGAKSLYLDILGLVQTHLRTGAWIIADNADYSPSYLQHVRSHTSGYLSVPFADDVELSLWTGK